MGDVIDMAAARSARSPRIRFQLDEEAMRVVMIIEDPELGAVYAGLTEQGVLSTVEGLIEAGRQLHKLRIARWSTHLTECTGLPKGVFDAFVLWWRNARPGLAPIRDISPERARELVLEAAYEVALGVFRRFEVSAPQSLIASRMMLAHLAWPDGTSLDPQVTCLVTNAHAVVLWSEL